MRSLSRRTFLGTSSCALAGLSVGVSRNVIAIPVRARQSVSSFGPDFFTPDTLRLLASGGIDAARSAGATYADIRISDLHTYEIDQGGPPLPGSALAFEFGYGIRVQVDGAWAFTYGTHLTADSIARSARTAVQTARGLAKVATRREELVSAPVVTGEWQALVQIDPFSVSPDEHAQLVGALKDAGTRLPDANLIQCRIRWHAETRVFASTEGSVVTQRLTRVDPSVFTEYPQDGPYGVTSIPIPGLMPVSGGFEYFLGTDLQERIKATIDEAARWARFPITTAELGRVPAIFDGSAVANLMGSTLIPALDLGRALGHEADGAGTSFLSPVNDVLGQPMFSPLLNVTVDRAMPHYGAARWDDEGVSTESFPVMQRGRVVDYFATRITTSTLAEWYAKRGVPPRSHGAAVSWRSSLTPVAWPSHVTVGTQANGPSLDGMIKQLSDGVLVRGGWNSGVASDPQLSGGLFVPAMMYEVKKGQITRRIMDGYLQFSTQKLWKNVTALGGDSSVEQYTRSEPLRPSFQRTTTSIAAPGAVIQQVDIVPLFRRRG